MSCDHNFITIILPPTVRNVEGEKGVFYVNTRFDREYIERIVRYLIVFFFVLYSSIANSHEHWQYEIDDKRVKAYVHGKTIQGDTLQFIFSIGNCEDVQENVTFHTTANNPDIENLQSTSLQLDINDKIISAKVLAIAPFIIDEVFYKQHLVMFSLGTYSLDEQIQYYENTKWYNITILDSISFNAEEYFDIPSNEWNIEGLPKALGIAKEKCEQIRA